MKVTRIVMVVIIGLSLMIIGLEAQGTPPVSKPGQAAQAQPQKGPQPGMPGRGMGPGPGQGRGQMAGPQRGQMAGQQRGQGMAAQPCNIVLSQGSRMIGLPTSISPGRWRIIIRERKGSELITSINALTCRPGSPLLTPEVVIRETAGPMQGGGQQGALRQGMGMNQDAQMGRGMGMIRNGPVRVGEGIAPPQKIKDVKPVYPAEAQASRVQGVVILEVTINRLGKVTNARVLRSIPQLDQAAIDAVNQWEFTPTLLNGQPVPVIMTVTVNFTLQ